MPRTETLGEMARRLRDLHRPGEPLLFTNVWDVASARAVARSGVPAIATSSFAVAAALGYADGEAMPAEVAFSALARIVTAVEVPVTADLEAGYGLAPEAFVAALLEAGAVGCNLEDTDHRHGGLIPTADAEARIAGVVEAGRRRGVDLVVNARVDCFLDGEPSPERLEDAVDRARAYRRAGAACIYPIAAADEDELTTMVGEAGIVNAYRFPAGPSLRRLRELGVARISVGPNLAREADAWITERARALAEELR